MRHDSQIYTEGIIYKLNTMLRSVEGDLMRGEAHTFQLKILYSSILLTSVR